MSSGNSCVETSDAPEWLSKLEHRREKLTRGRLGHESGSGSPCNACGEKCPGLDLHFWRKVCRNCKCRKDQHELSDDELSGWAQFEILGQIRSKPAFIKIKALANQPVQLEWVPPNAAPDVVSDYMEKLGTAQIPVAGSDAAFKRKQQLEFQVPPHDLDAALCDNLTENEASQLQQYVERIRDNCVGQGKVVRVGGVSHARIGHVPTIPTFPDVEAAHIFSPEYATVMTSLREKIVDDRVLAELLVTEKLARALVSTESRPPNYARMFIAFATPITESEALEFDRPEIRLSAATRQKLCGLDKQAVQSLVHNGPIYDKIIAVLQDKKLDISRDPRLGPIADFRKEYLNNPQFKQEIDTVCRTAECGGGTPSQYATPIKSRSGASEQLPFNSPLPLKQPVQTRFGAQMRQDTPMRKVKFGGTSTLLYDCGLPPNVDYERDALFAQLLHSEPLRQAVLSARSGHQTNAVVIALSPLPPPEFMDEPALSGATKQQLAAMGVDTRALQSTVVNGPFYDRLFQTLHDNGVNYNGCRLLGPLQQLRAALLANSALSAEVRQYVLQLPSSLDMAYSNPLASIKGTLTASQSNDSGFDSKPSTPNQPNASAGHFMSIPWIEEMNMYPSVEPSNAAFGAAGLPQTLLSLHISGNGKDSTSEVTPILQCRDCGQPIVFGEVAVKAERAGKEIAWHPDCFKCQTCRELLADLVYFFHGGQVYCGRDLAIKLKIPRCRACDELIFTKEYTAAENATFHLKHFCCFQCDEPLAGQQYIPDEKSNMPLCLRCYDKFYAAACERCRRPIGPADQGVAWSEVHWHGSCFVCAGVGCAKSLLGGRFCVKERMPYCSPACVRGKMPY